MFESVRLGIQVFMLIVLGHHLGFWKQGSKFESDRDLNLRIQEFLSAWTLRHFGLVGPFPVQLPV